MRQMEREGGDEGVRRREGFCGRQCKEAVSFLALCCCERRGFLQCAFALQPCTTHYRTRYLPPNVTKKKSYTHCIRFSPEILTIFFFLSFLVRFLVVSIHHVLVVSSGGVTLSRQQ